MGAKLAISCNQALVDIYIRVLKTTQRLQGFDPRTFSVLVSSAASPNFSNQQKENSLVESNHSFYIIRYVLLSSIHQRNSFVIFQKQNRIVGTGANPTIASYNATNS
jgi:hypothetical protein